MPWPAWLDQVGEHGTTYVSPGHLDALVRNGHGAGQAWRYKGQWSTYVPSRRQSFKTLQRIRPDGEEDFWHIMDSARAAGCAPPSSFADLWSQIKPSPMPRRSVIAPFVGMTFGGWMESLWRGTWRDPVWHYDLNKAYRWAACQGLPEMWSAYPLPPRLDPVTPSVYLVDLPAGARRYAPAPGRALLTWEEIPWLEHPEAVRVIRAVGFRRLVDLGPSFEKIDCLFPWCRDRISRAFWGSWNTMRAPERVTWRSGETVTPMKNPFYNPVWAACITSRIKLRLLPLVRRASVLHLCVDAVLSMEELPTGDEPGAWKLVGEYPSVWIKRTNYWGTGTRMIKHAGVMTDGRPET